MDQTVRVTVKLFPLVKLPVIIDFVDRPETTQEEFIKMISITIIKIRVRFLVRNSLLYFHTHGLCSSFKHCFENYSAHLNKLLAGTGF
jgi:hypothetical protein